MSQKLFLWERLGQDHSTFSLRYHYILGEIKVLSRIKCHCYLSYIALSDPSTVSCEPRLLSHLLSKSLRSCSFTLLVRPYFLSLSFFFPLHFTNSYRERLTLCLSGQSSNCRCKWKVKCPIHIPSKVIIRGAPRFWLGTAGVWERGTRGKQKGGGGDPKGL